MNRLAIVLTGLALSLFAASPAAAVRSEFFGIAHGAPLESQDLHAMAAAGIRTDRFLLFWGSVEPSKGSFNWGPTDGRVGALASHGIRTVPALWGNPEWVGGSSSTPPVFGQKGERAWRDFLEAAVARYGPGGSYWAGAYRRQFPGKAPLPIQAWQVWNEPNLKAFFAPHPSAGRYARLLQISHDAIKSRDPRARIVLAGMPGWGDVTAWDFLKKLYAVGGIKADFDVAALHPYARDLDHVSLAIQRVRAVMTNHADGATPLWLTELAWGSAPPDSYGINKGPIAQRQMLSGAFKLILRHRRAWNVQRLFWYRLRDPVNPTAKCSFCGSAGLRRNDHTPKPAFRPFKSLVAEKTPPRAGITSGPDQGSVTKNSTPQFSLASNEPGSTFVCRFDASSFKACSSPFRRGSPLKDSRHTISVKAIDAPGNVSRVRSRSFTVDTTAPKVTIFSGPKDGSSSSEPNPSFGFASNEPGAELRCRLDGGRHVPCSSRFTVSGLTDGSHTFEVRATDRAGNQGSADSTWTVDTIAPTVTISSGPNDGSSSPDRNPSFGFASNEPGAHLRCELDSGGFAPCTSPYAASPLGDGQHTLAVKATDQAGNTGSAASRAWTIDVPAPPFLVQIISGPASGSATSDTTPSFSFSSPRSGAAFRCRIDGAPFATCSAPFTAPTLVDGEHSFEIKATDGAEVSEVRSRSFTVDTTVPKVTISSGPADDSTSSNPTPSFGFVSNEPGSRFLCQLDSGGRVPCSSPYVASRLADGHHWFGVRAIDPAGNMGEPLDLEFTLDTAPPKVGIRGPRQVRTKRSKVAASFTLMAPGRVGLRCRIDSKRLTPCSSRYRTPKLRRGRHTLKVQATDRAGNVGFKRKRFKIVKRAGGGGMSPPVLVDPLKAGQPTSDAGYRGEATPTPVLSKSPTPASLARRGCVGATHDCERQGPSHGAGMSGLAIVLTILAVSLVVPPTAVVARMEFFGTRR